MEDNLVEFYFNDRNLKKLAAKYVKHRDLEFAAMDMGFSGDDVEEFFIDYPEREDKFDQFVYDHSTKLGKRKIRAGLDEAIGKLNELISDPDEDQNNAFRSASKIVDVWTKIDAANKDEKEKDEDDLDLIWRAIDNEQTAKESSKDNKRIGEKL